MQNGLPVVAVHDIVIHPRDRDVILGTHGRGIYILDDITALEEWKPALATTAAHVFVQRAATIWVDESRSGQMGENTYAGVNPPYIEPVNYQLRDRSHIVNTPLITFSLGAGASGTATLEITSPDGRSRALSVPAKSGITRYAWDGRMEAPPTAAAGARVRRSPPAVIAPGVYKLKLTYGGMTSNGSIVIRPDPLLKR